MINIAARGPTRHTPARDTVEGSKRRATFMFYHISAGLMIAMLVPFRIWLRLTRKLPPALPSPLPMYAAAHASHYLLYAGLVWMATTGLSMAWYSNQGAPL